MSNLSSMSSPTGADGSEYNADTSSSTKTAAAHTANVAADQASKVGGTAAAAAGQVTDVTKDEVGKVAAETKKQAKDLLTDARSQLTEQAGEQQARVAGGLHSISEELTQMATASNEDGVAADLVRQAATRAGSVATWLDDRDPGSLLDEVRSYARRKPGTFIALAAAAGVLAGRLTRSVAADSGDKAASDPAGAPPVGQPSYDGTAPLYTRDAEPWADPASTAGVAGAGGIAGPTSTAGMVGVTDTGDRVNFAERTGLVGDDPDLMVPER